MVIFILFNDPMRQEEVDTFYEACQMQRNYYRGYPGWYHPLQLFGDREYMWQCPSAMTEVYLSFPPFHVKYKQPVSLPEFLGGTSGIPPLPDRTLAGRYEKGPCQRFIR